MAQRRRLLTNIPLRYVLVVPFVVQSVGIVALVGYFSARSGQRDVANLTQQLLYQTSKRVEDHLQDYFQTSQQAISANHLALNQGRFSIDQPEQLRSQLWQQITLNPSIPSTGFWSEEGTAILYLQVDSLTMQKFIQQVSGERLPLGTVFLQEIRPNQRRFYRVNSQGQPQQLI
ncbi:MAG: hypothetical protein SFW36_21600, partial [Leptolyngbyaceae cyanobacterium bins.59]|nr:hypothetical protein [Leptolyngbyaceae cyanobacterium bins.59]